MVVEVRVRADDGLAVPLVDLLYIFGSFWVAGERQARTIWAGRRAGLEGVRSERRRQCRHFAVEDTTSFLPTPCISLNMVVEVRLRQEDFHV